jgi:glucan phosphoethanolaminetransferase (alkaline phosphatase superfamily)
MWFSDKYLKLHNKTSANIDSNIPISHDFVFHSLLGCSGFSGDYFEDKLNICNKLK